MNRYSKELIMNYEMTIAGCKRQLPLCKITDDLYIGAFIMFSDVEITRAAAAELLSRAPEFDVIITAESKGIRWPTKWQDRPVSTTTSLPERVPNCTCRT